VIERLAAWLGTIVFLFAMPGVVAGVVPFFICGWQPAPGASAASLFGGAGIALGVVFLLHSFVEFAARGIGTPAPIAPTKHLVVTGAYRYVRNPMYLAVLAIIFGQAVLFRNASVAVYGVVIFVTVALFVLGYEEPILEERFGGEYVQYRASVPRWVPRFTPYEGPRDAPDATP
jgi:protein-S-isoprenylcysteine O-methyltransferase Ste14